MLHSILTKAHNFITPLDVKEIYENWNVSLVKKALKIILRSQEQLWLKEHPLRACIDLVLE